MIVRSSARLMVLPVLIGVMLLAGGCTTVTVRGGPSCDAGTLAVSGVETGWGWGGEIIGYTRSAAESYGLGGAVHGAGYSTGGDADPILFTTVESRYRHDFGPRRGRGVYGELGAGLGVAWSPSIDRVAVPLQAELGYQVRRRNALFSIGLRERFLGLVGTGSPPFDAFNSVQLVAGIGFATTREP